MQVVGRGCIAGMALITPGLGHILQNFALKHLPARTVSFATLVGPLSASVAAADFFRESLTPQRTGAGILVFTDMGWAIRVSHG